MTGKAADMSNNASASIYQSTSTNSSTSTLRPRNPRLISYLDDDSTNNEAVAVTTSNSSTPPRFGSRNASPSTYNTTTRTKGNPPSQNTIPTIHDAGGKQYQRSASGGVNKSTSGPLWDSWSSLQGIASTFLGSNVSNTSVRRASSVKKAGYMQQDKSTISKQLTQEWGPKTDNKVQSLSAEDQKALLQAKKREALLAGSVDALRDSLGRFKRKDSDADTQPYIAEQGAEDDVLVYRHKVLPQDTMAGVLIKYSCQPEAFRKANRFWPNDNIQRRDFVVLPVNACGVKSRKVDGPHAVDLLHAELGDASIRETSSKRANGPTISDNNAAESSTFTEPFPLAEVKEEDESYKHEHWVVIPSFPHAIEILRVSKRVLGYFPPTRRKSNSNSPLVDSGASTPKTSFDTLRHPPSHAAQLAQLHQKLHSISPSRSPIRQTSIPRHLNSPSRNRSSSTVSATNGTSNPFLTALQGPGGVGTLRGLRTERALPGPAEDPLNKKFAQYMPDFLPPEVDRSSSSLLHPVYGSRTPSRRATPRASSDSTRSIRSNSSTVPGGIEGWMRKVAGSGAAAVVTTSPMRKKGDIARNNSSDLFGQVSAAAGTDGGDLIELDVTPDAISRQLHDEVGDDDATPTATAMPTPVIPDESGGGGEAAAGKMSVWEEEELNERFPVRGRVRRAYQAD